MGPNGSGKSTLAYAIAGHPKYTVTSGTVTLDGEDVLAMTVDERARAGLFLAMQYPVEVPGSRSPTSCAPRRPRSAARRPSCGPWSRTSTPPWTSCSIDPAFAERNVNEGFSGGEKKRHEILQLRAAQPEDRDPGRDRLRPRHRRAARWCPRGSTGSAAKPATGVLLITHYTRILRYIAAGFRARVRRRPHRRPGRP